MLASAEDVVLLADRPNELQTMLDTSSEVAAQAGTLVQCVPVCLTAQGLLREKLLRPLSS